ncbi:MAG: ribulose-5-phosphate 4-epimerase/fuculose-1-phosphate aldolase [Gammaproteobacteria bacterium]|jgi:ribulose-5-phosphate 4-epimerase/fuculose-1-phosphate aldolase
MVAVPQSLSPDNISEAEWAVRVDLAAAYRLVDMLGWSDGIGTHISARIPGPEDHFLLNPYGLLFDEITASSLIKVDLNGNALSESEYAVNPAGFVIHSAVHMSNPELACVLHTHTTAGTSIATQRDGLLPLNQHALQVLYTIAYHDYEGPATDYDERERIVSDLADNKVLVLRNHGLLTVGATVAEAFVWMYRAERACRMQLAFQQSGAELNPISNAVQQISMDRSRQFTSANGHRPTGKLEWPAWLRRVERLDPSYKH